MNDVISRAFLCHYLLKYELPSDFSENQYHALMRVLIHSQLHGCVAKNIGNITAYPPPFKRHLRSIATFSKAQNVQVVRACQIIERDLKALGSPVLLLKGAAYIAAKKANANGRLISDIDILLAKESLSTAEALLLSSGWKVKELDDFDEKYYREWSHELPPYTHLETGVTLDIHHNLLPGSAGKSIDIHNIIESRQATDLGLFVPADEYLILHSAIHLLLNDDIEKGLRDCLDLHLLIQQYAVKHDLGLLYEIFVSSGCKDEYAILLQLLNRLFGDEAKVYTQKSPHIFNQRHYKTIIDDLEKAVFPSCEYLHDSKNSRARLKVYLRGHLSKMPLVLLLKHLSYKAYRTSVKKIFGEYVFQKEDTKH